MLMVLEALLLLLTIAVIFVNGWTDAPGAIATAVATGSISYRRAVGMAAVCNLLGLVGMSLVSTSVTDTMLSLAQFDPALPHLAVAALCAAMLTIVVFAVAAWAFGIPTSESHALIAALTGASLALGGAASVDGAAWRKVLLGLLLSLALGLAAGYLLTALLSRPLSRCSGRLLDRFQVAAAAVTAFFHGAQDGQKFVAVLVLVDLLTRGSGAAGPVDLRGHKLTFLLCAIVMAMGTAVGGRRIIFTVGRKMAPLQKQQGVCSDLAGGLCLLLASLTGVPVSTTHTKTTAIMGAGLRGSRQKFDFGVMGSMLAAWGITFPVCGALGWLLTRWFCALI